MPDLILDDRDMPPDDLRPEKRKTEEISRGQRKCRVEEDLQGDKREHSLTESGKVYHPQGFYSEEWDEDRSRQVPKDF